MDISGLILLVIFLFLLSLASHAGAIRCFVCSSLDGSSRACEDPFHNNRSESYLDPDCRAGRKEREGLFPATACIKVSGKYANTGKYMVVRTCALDSGSLTTDTELVRQSHCGSFKFNGLDVSGCVQSCMEDGCNSGHSFFSPAFIITFNLIIICLAGYTSLSSFLQIFIGTLILIYAPNLIAKFHFILDVLVH